MYHATWRTFHCCGVLARDNIVPADNKWYSRLVVSAAVVETLNSLQLEFPVMDKPKKAELEKVWKLLVKEER